jgi:hypothetical protein
MIFLCSTRVVLLFLLLNLLGCSSKEKEAVAPIKELPTLTKSLVGRWDVIEASISYYGVDGQYLKTSLLPEEGEKHYIFEANGKFERHTKNGSFETGSYVYTDNNLVLTFSHGIYRCTIPPAISSSDLTLIEDTRNLTTVPERRRNRVILAQLKRNI